MTLDEIPAEVLGLLSDEPISKSDLLTLLEDKLPDILRADLKKQAASGLDLLQRAGLAKGSTKITATALGMNYAARPTRKTLGRMVKTLESSRQEPAVIVQALQKLNRADPDLLQSAVCAATGKRPAKSGQRQAHSAISDALSDLLPGSDARVALGYLFISGLAKLAGPLGDAKRIRLLISNMTDGPDSESLVSQFQDVRTVRNDLARRSHLDNSRKDKILEDAKAHIQNSLEYMAQSPEEKTIITAMIDLIEAGKLEVRVYPKEKLHARVYLLDGSAALVGSVNASMSDIPHASETYLETSDPSELQRLGGWFDGLWKTGLDITEELGVILSNSWAGKPYSPQDVFLKAAYIDLASKLGSQHEFDPVRNMDFPDLFAFQTDAVDQGLTMFENHRGVIIADVVGMGKTYIGISLLKHLQYRGYRPLVICPPALEEMWAQFCAEYRVDAKVLSRGLLSQRGFDLYRDYRYKSRNLVLIDESHHFRNTKTRQYENLHLFMQMNDARAILLTATPFSNNAADVKNQIMLFHPSAKTTIPPANETDLDQHFKKIEKGDADLTDILRNIMIRRTRRYILNQYGKDDDRGRRFLDIGSDRKYFPDRVMMSERYDIDAVYRSKYDEMVRLLDKSNLTLARYGPGLYLRDAYRDEEGYRDLNTAGNQIIPLIRHLLLKRMESSLEAFRTSIERYIVTHRYILHLLEKNKVPFGTDIVGDMYDLLNYDPDETEGALEDLVMRALEEQMGSTETRYKIEAFRADEMKRDIARDLETFQKIKSLLDGAGPRNDHKLITLQKLLDKYRDKKVIIFTEFSTTARYIDQNIAWSGGKGQADSKKGNAIKYARLFDPVNNPGRISGDEISLLISTDVLSEGINLQAGEVIINYDFHWNPVRLIQRAGRVDRIGNKHEKILIHNFLPDPRIEEDLGLEASVVGKINEIQRVIGEDYKILTKDETINTDDIYAIYKSNESVLDGKGRDPLEPSRFEQILRDIRSSRPKYWQYVQNMPSGIRGSDTSCNNLLMACEIEFGSRKTRRYYLVSDGSAKELSGQRALEYLESADTDIRDTDSRYDDLVRAGWDRFLSDIDQLKAAYNDKPKLGRTQSWIVDNLHRLGGMDAFEDRRQTLEELLRAFSVPIFRGPLSRKLSQIKKSNKGDEFLFDSLCDIYKSYEMDRRADKAEEISPPRILYTRYVQ